MKVLISEYFKDDGTVAKVFKDEENWIEYVDKNGERITFETFPGKSIHYVEDAAENYALGIKTQIGN